MPKEIDNKIISDILDDKLFFSDDEELSVDDQKILGYSYKEHSQENKNLIVSMAEEIKSLVFQIINEVYKKNLFFEALGITNISEFENYFIKEISNILERFNIRKDRFNGTNKVLKNNGEIKQHDIFIMNLSFDEFLNSLNTIKSYYSNNLNKIKDLSIENTVNSMGYSSSQEMGVYFKKFLDLQKTPEYIDFARRDGLTMLGNKRFFTLKSLKELFDPFTITKLTINPELEYFFLFDKYKIDNFKEFINSCKINVETEMPTTFDYYGMSGSSKKRSIRAIDSHFYLDPNSDDKDNNTIENFVSSYDYNRYGNYGANIILIEHYYYEMFNYSYENGLYSLLYKFVINEIIDPVCNEALEKYKKHYDLYSIEKVIPLKFEKIKKLILDNIKTNSNNNFHLLSDSGVLIKKIISKKDMLPYLNRDFLNDLKKDLKIEIIKESKNNKNINIDNILKKIDSNYKNDNINTILKINITEGKKNILEDFNKFFIDKFSDSILYNFRSRIISDLSDPEKNITKEFIKHNESDDKPSFDIKKLLSDEELRFILLKNKSYEKRLYSYKISMSYIDEFIIPYLKSQLTNEIIRNKFYYYLENVNNNSIETFFNNLKKILIKQLQQEELFLQGKSSSMGILDDIKFKDSSIKDLPINVPLDKILIDNIGELNSYADNGIFNILKSFDSQIFKNFNYILRYFQIFPNEAETFFNLNDFNQIKNSIIKMFNFINSNENYDKLYKIESLLQESAIYMNEKNEVVNPDKDSEPKSKLIAIQFLTKLLKDKDLGSKSQRIERIEQIAQLMHNYSSNYYYLNLIIKSRYFEKSYNKSIFDVFNGIGTVIESVNNLLEKINYIKEVNPILIPNDYLADNIIYCISNIENIKTSGDLDKIIEKLLIGDYSENIKKFKFLLTVGSDYEAVVKWMDKAIPKKEEVFAPNLSTESFRFRVLGDLDPYHFRVGIDTDCCQAIGNAGEASAIDSFINPNAGVVLLERKIDNSWNLAAQSYFHYAEVNNEKAIMLDNIEAGGFQRNNDKEFYRKAYAILGAHLKGMGFDIVGCGTAHTLVIGSKDFDKKSLKSDPRHFEVRKYKTKYTDFNSSNFYNLLEPKFSFEMPKDINSAEIEMSTKSAAILDICIKKTGNKKAISLNNLSRILRKNGLIKEATDIRRLILNF